MPRVRVRIRKKFECDWRSRPLHWVGVFFLHRLHFRSQHGNSNGEAEAKRAGAALTKYPFVQAQRFIDLTTVLANLLFLVPRFIAEPECAS